MASSSGSGVQGDDPFYKIDVELRELKAKNREQRRLIHHVDPLAERRYEKVAEDANQLHQEYVSKESQQGAKITKLELKISCLETQLYALIVELHPEKSVISSDVTGPSVPPRS